MSDEFLYEAGPPLREGFAEALYERLSQSGRGLVALPWWFGFNRKTVAYVFSAVLVAVIAVACARELFKPRYVQVGEMWVLEVGRSYSYEIMLPAMSQLESQNTLSRPPEAISIAGAIELLPYSLEFPWWIPNGYSPSERETRPPRHPDWFLSLNWVNGSGDRLAFWSSRSPGAEIRAPAGTWEELQVHGRPAVLVRGRFPGLPDMSMLWEPAVTFPTPGPEPAIWKLEDRWDEEAGLGLTWHVGGATLHLQTYGPYLSLEDLVRIAESIARP